jgi:hypothetical protein
MAYLFIGSSELRGRRVDVPRHPLVAAQWPRLDPAGLPQLLAVLLSPDGRVIAQRRTVVGGG